MKLIALKNISSRLPKGAIFEEGNKARARMLIHAKVAAAHTAAVEAAAPIPAVTTAPEPVPAPIDPEPQPEPATAPVTPRRGNRVGAHGYQRNG